MRTWSGKIEEREWLIIMSTRLCSSHLLLSVYAMWCDVKVIGTNYERVIIMSVSDVIWSCYVIPWMHFLYTDLGCVTNPTCSICCKLNGLWISKQVRTFIPQNFSRRTNSLIREASAFQAFQWRRNSVINVICDAIIKSEPFIIKYENIKKGAALVATANFEFDRLTRLQLFLSFYEIFRSDCASKLDSRMLRLASSSRLLGTRGMRLFFLPSKL